MSVGRILTLGFGSFGGVRFLPTIGYAAGAVPSVVVTTQPSGVGHAKPPLIRFSDLSPDSRQSTADFIKAQLAKSQPQYETPKPPTTYKTGRKGKAARERERLAELAALNAEIERQDEIRTITNNNIIILLMMANG